MWNLIKFWRRYIDDILGIWRGTERQFKQFISNLNSLTLPYGIKFDKTKIGKSSNFLDTTLYLEKDDSGKWKIQHGLYRKPADAEDFLEGIVFIHRTSLNLYRIHNIYVLFHVTLKKVPEMKV